MVVLLTKWIFLMRKTEIQALWIVCSIIVISLMGILQKWL